MLEIEDKKGRREWCGQTENGCWSVTIGKDGYIWTGFVTWRNGEFSTWLIGDTKSKVRKQAEVIIENKMVEDILLDGEDKPQNQDWRLQLS